MGTIIEAYKKYMAEHPQSVDVGTIVGLEAKPDYRTESAQMKAKGKLN